MGTVSQPVGGHSPAAEQKLGNVPHEEKTSIVYVFLAVIVLSWSCTGYVVNKTVSCVLMNMILVTMI
jgi:hypothetical protein